MLLHCFEWTLAEVAETLGMSKGSVQVHDRRGHGAAPPRIGGVVMPDLEDQLRAYGRQIEQHVADSADTAEGSLPSESAAERKPPVWRSPWFLVAAATAAVAVAASLLLPADPSRRRKRHEQQGFRDDGRHLPDPRRLHQRRRHRSSPGTQRGRPADQLSSRRTICPRCSTDRPRSRLAPIGSTCSARRYRSRFQTDSRSLPIPRSRIWRSYVHVSFLDIQYVYRDSCDYHRQRRRVGGPTVDDLVALVVAQKNSVISGASADRVGRLHRSRAHRVACLAGLDPVHLRRRRTLALGRHPASSGADGGKDRDRSTPCGSSTSTESAASSPSARLTSCRPSPGPIGRHGRLAAARLSHPDSRSPVSARPARDPARPGTPSTPGTRPAGPPARRGRRRRAGRGRARRR